MKEIEKYNQAIKKIEAPFIGLPYVSLLLIKSLILIADPSTGIVQDLSYRDIAKTLTVNPSQGRKESGTPTKESIRNYIKTIERYCGEHFKVISNGQNLRFIFPELPKIFKSIFKNTEVNIQTNSAKSQDNTDGNKIYVAKVNTKINMEVNTHNSPVKNININKITNTNKQTQTGKADFSPAKKQIDTDFYPSANTIEIAISMGLTKVEDPKEIQAFINHNKKYNTQWADFNPVFITWLERDAQYIQSKQQKEQGRLRSYHNERGSNQSTINPTALERVSEYHGISIDSLWNGSDSRQSSSTYIEGAFIQSVDEADFNLRSIVY